MIEFLTLDSEVPIHFTTMSRAERAAATDDSGTLRARVALCLANALDAGYTELPAELEALVTDRRLVLVEDPEWRLVGALVKDRIHYLVFDIEALTDGAV